MKKLLTVVFTMLLAGTLAFAQAPASSDNKTTGSEPAKATTAKKGSKSKAHKGGKKSKKSSSTTSTTPPAK
jgi:hypothetical protein